MPLNKSKGNMYDFVTHTWNPIRGECSHSCDYCHPYGTLIMMADFTQKPIESVCIGDNIIGISKELSNGFYRFCRTKVVNTSKRNHKILKFTTDENELYCTPEHPLMSSTEARGCTDWRQAKSISPYQSLRYVSNFSRGDFSLDKRLGYLKGAIDGDGCIFKHYNNEKREYLGFEMVCVDEALTSRVESELKSILNVEVRRSIKRANKASYGGDCPMLTTRKSKDVEKMVEGLSYKNNIEFAKGYIAGMIDTDGSVSKSGSIRIAQSKIANNKKYNKIKKYLDLIGVPYVEEIDVIRIRSAFERRMEVLFEFGIFHSEKSKRLLIGMTIKGSIHSKVNKVEAAGYGEVYNLQTESETFIANGFIVHNCYMKSMWKRFPEMRELQFVEKEMNTNLGTGKYIFVGSSTDMFAENIPDEWIKKVLWHCSESDNKYIFQTKNPERFSEHLDLPVMNTSVVCTTIESNREYPVYMKNSPSPKERAKEMSFIKRMEIDTYITIEPIMQFDLAELVDMIKTCSPIQVNVGADSGNNNLPEPTGDEVRSLITELEKFTKVKQKDNLKRLLK